MICGWSEWINLSKPTSGPNGGDDESIHNIISAGYHICSAPEEVQCRSVLYPGLPMSEMDKTVTCNKDVGFICNNKTTRAYTTSTNYNLNYFHHSNIQYPHSLHHSNNYNTLNSFHHSNNYNTLYYFHQSNNCNPINSINNSYSLNTFEYNNYFTFYHNRNNNTSANHKWTLPEWINLGKPTSGPNGGDDESIHNIISAGYHICSAPEEVQCRSVLYPGLPMSEMGQTVTCNKDVGFICNNKQQGPTQHNNYNTLNSLHHSNNYNTLNSFHHIKLQHPQLLPPQYNYNTLYYFHHSNNCNTINSINNSYSLNTFEYNNYYTFYHNRNNNTSANHNCTLPWWT
ncbi:hypothetical protein F7725_025898 [Dissostichus mawsoni]|uniref:WxxW domain-containing protein n=1 Tax=Dissostichus mawsoni TaxID=36200 RepID=A0A7J5X5Y0_DISMA|nr:hypothetical protein F7725_025898 [Dissostichus mawsoni]